jgi:hypothetical protein
MSAKRAKTMQDVLGPEDKYLVLLCHCRDHPVQNIYEDGLVRPVGSEALFIDPRCDSWNAVRPHSVKMIYGINCPVYHNFKTFAKFGYDQESPWSFFVKSYAALKKGGSLIFPNYGNFEINALFRETFEYDDLGVRRWKIHYIKDAKFFIASAATLASKQNCRSLIMFEKI